MAAQRLKTTCCVVGGGPAGMMLGFLLARAGVKVAVLEKHADFLRDFRGDTIHPSTLQLMHELGLLEEFLKLPHARVDHLGGQIGATRITVADFTHLPTVCKYIALMPQWDFLDFIAAHGKRYPGLRPAHEDGSDRPDRGGRPCRRRARQITRGRTRNPRGSHGRHRRKTFDVARMRGLPCRQPGRAHGRLVVPHVAQGKRRVRNLRPRRSRPHVDHAQPHRLLAVRLSDPQGRLRQGEGQGARRLPRRHRRDDTVSARPRAGDHRLGSRQAA